MRYGSKKRGAILSPQHTWKHTTKNYHQVGIAHLVLKWKLTISFIAFVSHLKLRLRLIRYRFGFCGTFSILWGVCIQLDIKVACTGFFYVKVNPPIFLVLFDDICQDTRKTIAYCFPSSSSPPMSVFTSPSLS